MQDVSKRSAEYRYVAEKDVSSPYKRCACTFFFFRPPLPFIPSAVLLLKGKWSRWRFSCLGLVTTAAKLVGWWGRTGRGGGARPGV